MIFDILSFKHQRSMQNFGVIGLKWNVRHSDFPFGKNMFFSQNLILFKNTHTTTKIKSNLFFFFGKHFLEIRFKMLLCATKMSNGECRWQRVWWWICTWSWQDVYLTMKSEWAPCMICFSERMCSCCLVSTMWRFLRIFIAKVLDSSLFNWTLKKGSSKSENACRIKKTECILHPKLSGGWST